MLRLRYTVTTVVILIISAITFVEDKNNSDNNSKDSYRPVPGSVAGCRVFHVQSLWTSEHLRWTTQSLAFPNLENA